MLTTGMIFVLTIATILSGQTLFAMNPFQRCAVALSASVMKGPKQGVIAWRHFADDNTWWGPRPTVQSRREYVAFQTRLLSRELDRDVTPQNAVAVARELIADPATGAGVLRDVVAVLRDVDLMSGGAELIAQLRAHPHMDSPSSVLWIAGNVTSGLNPRDVADLVMDILNSQAGEDVIVGDIPLSAHPAKYLSELQEQGRLAMADFGRAYVFLIDTPRAGSSALYWILSDLHHWAERRYVYGGPLPPRDMSYTLVEKARRRLAGLKYRQDILIERVDQTARLLGL